MPQGTSLYLRGIRKSRHKSPREFAKKVVDHGLTWLAIAAIWQELRNGRVTTRRMNSLDNVNRYRDALEAQGVEVYVWGYPWIGEEQRFVDLMTEYDGGRGLVLLDPEKGANPAHDQRGAGKKAANEHAAFLVRLFAAALSSKATLGLSTFGSGWRMGWFPLLAFTRALIEHFGGRTFIGGQTYTDDGVIDRSIADMMTVIQKAGGSVIQPGGLLSPTHGVEVVPNFGTYVWQDPKTGRRGRRTKGAKPKPKTVEELRLHLFEFIDEGEPVDAMIGWAENFMTDATWGELARFAALLERGACRLPRA